MFQPTFPTYEIYFLPLRLIYDAKPKHDIEGKVVKRVGDTTINIPTWSSFNVLVSGPHCTGISPKRAPKGRVITPN